jgi:IclR family acetate operon transcriptional repressor
MSTNGEAFFVMRTMQALEVLSFQPASAPQVATALNVDARTARRLLNRLVSEGWLTRSEGRRRMYSPSLRIAALAAHVVRAAPLPKAAQPVIDRLHAQTAASAHLAIPSYRAVLALAQSADVPLPPRLWELAPCHCTAAGKTLLAYREAWRESVLSSPLELRTPHTVTDPDAIRSASDDVVTRGYAEEHGENEESLHGVAAPVRLRTGEVLSAVGVTWRGDDRPADVAAAVRRAAQELEQALARSADDA